MGRKPSGADTLVNAGRQGTIYFAQRRLGLFAGACQQWVGVAKRSYKPTCRIIHQVTSSPLASITDMFNDIRLALRQLAAAKGFTITAVVTLALGIAANTGIFTLVHALMMKSLPVADPQRIIRIGDGDNCCVLEGLQGRFSINSHPLYQYIREHTPEFEDMSAFQAGIGEVGVRRARVNTPEPFVDQFVSGNYFTLFGLRAFASRLIASSDDVRSAAPVAVMSYRAWQQHFGGGPADYWRRLYHRRRTVLGDRHCAAGVFRRGPAPGSAGLLDAAGHRTRSSCEECACGSEASPLDWG